MLDESEYFQDYILRHELIRCVYCPWGQIKIKVTQLFSPLCPALRRPAMFGPSFSSSKCKPQLKMAVQRVSLITNKKTQISECSLFERDPARSRPRISRGRPLAPAPVSPAVSTTLGTWPAFVSRVIRQDRTDVGLCTRSIPIFSSNLRLPLCLSVFISVYLSVSVCLYLTISHQRAANIGQSPTYHPQ